MSNMNNKFEEVESMLNKYADALNQYNTHFELIALETKEEIIEGMSINAAIMDDMPKSVINKFSSKTEDSAINYKYYLHKTKEEIEAEKLIVNNLKESKEPVHKMLITLSAEDRCIIYSLYIHNLSYNKTLRRLIEEFPKTVMISRESIKWRKKKILRKLASEISK